MLRAHTRARARTPQGPPALPYTRRCPCPGPACSTTPLSPRVTKSCCTSRSALTHQWVQGVPWIRCC